MQLEEEKTDITEYLNYIDGEWSKSSSEEKFVTIDRATGERVSTCQSSS